MNTDFLKAKNDFLEAAKRTYESGIQTGTGGNLSVRIPNTELMIVKPSGFTYGSCTEDNLCITDFDGNLIDGKFKPTRECTLHGNIYKRYPHVGGIVHTHSVYSILISMYYEQLELVTLHSELKFGCPLPVVDVATQSVTPEELPKVFEAIDANPGVMGFLLKRHGLVAMDKTAVKAGQTAELIEETAQIQWEKHKMDLLLKK
ncbi:MAG: class II aldolase/adducin family protein [Erysipelotrichaceae bacterium]|nr:class II aldolase/adducin family protein [Erysipelotrichaceae bacterium]